MSQSNKKRRSRQSPKFISKRRTTKPSLSVLTQQDSGNKLITPSSRTSHLHSAIYKIGKPEPTFFNVDNPHNISNEIKSQLNDNNDIYGNFKSTKFEEKVNRKSTPITQRRNILDTTEMRARYNSIRNRSISINSSKSSSDCKEREKIVTKNFIQKEMTKLAYEKYICSPFAFIDRVDNGDIPLTEFVYLNEIGPYDLEIVSSDCINNKNYYTLSSQGLTHFYCDNNGIIQVIFTPLDQWQREYYLFTSMMNIPFFNQYKKWKSFRIWKKCIQRDKIRICNNMMNNNLFILNKHLRKPLFEIRKLCCSMIEWKLFILTNDNNNTHKSHQPLSLKQFLNLQTNHRNILKNKLYTMCNKIKIELLKACKNRLHHHLIENGFDDNENDTISHAQRAAVRTECRSLTKFIKMVDNFIQNAVMTLCRENVKTLLKYIQDKRKSIFLINLDIKDDTKQFILDPLVIDFQEGIRNVIHEAISIILQPPNFVNSDEELKQFTSESEVNIDGEDDNLIDLEQLLLNDSSFVSDMRHIQHGIIDAFDQSMSWIDELNKYLNIYFEKSPQTLSFEMTNANKFNDYLNKYSNQIQQFNLMPISNDISILRIDCKLIKDKFIPIPKERLKFIQEKLPQMAHLKCIQLINELSEMNENIKKTPITVSDFVTFKKHLKNVHLREEEVEYRFNEINDMFILINKHKIRLQKDTSKQHGKLHQIRSTLTTNVSISDSSIDDSTTKFTNFMKNAVPKLIKDIAAIRMNMENEEVLGKINKNAINETNDDINKTMSYIELEDDKLLKYENLSKDYAFYQENLDIEITEYERLSDTRNDLNIKKDLWFGIKTFNESIIKWKQCKLNELNMDDIQNDIKKYIKLISKCSRYLSPNQDVQHEVVEYLKLNVFELKKIVPIIEHLSSPSLQERHWNELSEKLDGYDIQKDSSFNLGTIFDRNLLKYEKEISFISVQALQEQSLIELLNKIILIWKECDMPLQPYKDYKNCYILGNLDDIIANLDESLVTIQTINSSRYVEPIKESVSEWNKKLVLFQETLDEWITMQRKWMYLETIFSGGDIAKQLPSETKLFSKIDKYWKDTMIQTYDNPDAINCGIYPGRKETMLTHNSSLDRIEKSLEEYLETKRQIFPRFYFLSNDELLEILADSKNPHKVQPHLRKCFDNIYELELLNDKSITIKSMISGEGERVLLGKNLKCGRKPVEEWLGALQVDMKKTLKKLIKNGVVQYEEMNNDRNQWIMTHKAQIVMSVSQIMWCKYTEIAINNNKLSKWLNTNIKQIDDLIVLVRGQLKKTDRKKIVALVTTDVHSRDVINKLINNNCESIMDFNWQKQLRFYWDFENDECIVKQISAVLNYGYEYMGISSRLVITPLTDRCWITVTGALHIKLGASPAGPAGTGKTESVKDLAKGLGIQCVVFNCSDQIDYKMMSKLFSGLAQTGSWTCLDEFNRIQIEVLSVVAQQLLSIRQALLAGLKRFNFSGNIISLSTCFGVNITMNPGYAGRTELPDNLKVLFRPVAMMIPDYGLIAEIMLFAEGFSAATILSKKMVKLYKLSSEQLSQQDHYDFGMRAVKSVLVMAGTLKRAQPNIDESTVLIRAMRDSNIPKFLTQDLPLFNAIVSDLFPSIKIPDNDYGELQEIIIKCILNRHLQPEPCFITKIIQLFDTFDVRFGVMLVGPTGGSKTEIYNVLCDAMNYLRLNIKHKDSRFQCVHLHILNPKSISMGELYGEMNLLTQEWTDGLASSIMRESIRDTSMDKHWVVFDGPVDTLWIESMNTVLDDNMTLCLANGERIKLKPELRMLFEVRDLAVASPATVSRCGMVYVPSDDLGVKPFVKSFFEKHFIMKTQSDNKYNTCLLYKVSDSIKEYILDLFLKHIEILISHKRELYNNNLIKIPIYSHDIAMATSTCYLFQSIFSIENGINLDTTHSNEEILKIIIEKIFVFSVIWSIGGNIDDGRDEFSDIIIELFPKIGFPKLKKAENNTVFDYCIDCKTNNWILWKDYVSDFKYDITMKYTSILVPTLDTYRYSYLIELLFDVNYSVFLTGDSGVGKTSISNDLINRLKTNKNTFPIILNFSAQTSAKSVQFGIEKKLQKRTKTKYGGPSNKKVLIFIDDINMPSKEEFGAQPPIELLRQFQDYRGFYDREKWFFKQIIDSTICCAAAPPGGGRSKLTERFIRHFNILCVPKPSIQVLTRIFQSILDGYLECNNFKSDIKLLSAPIVTSTINLYIDICKSLLPIPAKSHYTFNLRDISKVFQGILMCTSSTAKNKEIFTRLWIHESMRCFHDRLIDDADRDWFYQQIEIYLQKHFKITSIKKEEINNNIFWGDFFKGSGDKTYCQLNGGLNELNKILCGYLEDYNMESSSPMNLVFFDDAMKHLVRISRILRQERGNAMLVGVGGSGRQSLTKLACFILEYKCFQIELRRGYDYIMFRDDLKELMMNSGCNGKQTVFLFNDTQIIDERFLEDINNILNSGEVPNLFTENEEFQRIDDALHPFMKENDIGITPDNTWNTFVSRIRNNLHLVLCFSPVGDLFRTRCRMFPSLINCCTIDWYSKWPKQALLSVSNKFLSDLQFNNDDKKGNLIKENLSKMCEKVHSSVQLISDEFFNQLRRKVYTTPKSYLDMIKLYIKMLSEKRQELGLRRNTLRNGLKKLHEANSIVSTLKEDLKKLQPQLVIKQKEATELLAKIAVDQAEADKVKEKVLSEAKIVEKQAEETGAVQQDAQTDLDKALPALEAASSALNSLNKSDITEVKGMAKPPAGVVMVLEAVMILLNEKTAWDNAKKVMAGATFLKTLQQFDKDNIAPKKVQILKKKYISDADNFSVERMQKVSIAATALCKWVHAMVLYSEVSKTVEPKRKRLEEMNNALNEANVILKKKQDALQSIIDKVTELKRKCDLTVNEKKKLEFESNQCKERLVRAEKLTVGLADEQIRWKEQSERLGKEICDLVGDVFISSAFVSYAAPFTGIFRENLISIWMTKNNTIFSEIPHTEISSFSFLKILGNPLEIDEWNSYGLPTDDVSIESAIISKKGERWPLMIDPQNQAKTWIKNMEKLNNLHIVKLDDPNLLRVLEVGIRNGEPVLIEDIGESLDPSIDPILNKSIFKSGGRTLIHLGDNDIDYDMNFKFYISTKLSNPHYLPEISIKVTLINFTVTKTGLTEQLLGDVVKKERPEIDKKRTLLIKQMATDKQELKNIENTILKLLSQSKGHILDDIVLIDTLESSKKTSNIINQRVIESLKTEKQINETRSKYYCVAKRGSIIFFVIADMSLIDPMYQYSLNYFMKLFNSIIDKSQKTNDLNERLKILQNNITFLIYSNICRGLFERHKLIFSFLICSMIMLDSKQITQNEWMYFLRSSVQSTNDNITSPNPSIISNKSWLEILSLQTSFSEIFVNLSKNIQTKLFNSSSFWNSFFNENNREPHNLLFNISNDSKINKLKISTYGEFGNLTSFQLLLLLKTLKYEKIIFGISLFVEMNLGKNFVSLPPTKLSQVFRDTDKTTPIIFVLSTGADPQTLLLRFAKQMKYDNNLQILSLGQGQGIKAEKLINAAKISGDWVCLQNCHLAKSWMPSLEKIVINITENPEKVHNDFRLWLTSMPCDYFPVPVLQNGVKLTNEPPRGIRSNLMRSYAAINSTDFIDDNINNDVNYIYRRLLFSLSFFHAILQERRKFGALGFNKSYEFNDSDLETSMTILKIFLNKIENKSQIPWHALRYVIGEINYGGRVTDDWDRRCLMTILNSYYMENVLNKDEYSFINDVNDKIYKFNDGDLNYYKKYIENLPFQDDPIVFGMHENANITYQTQETNAMIQTVLDIQPRNIEKEDEEEQEEEEDNNNNNNECNDDDKRVNDIATDILSKLPSPLNVKDGENTFNESKESTRNGMMDSLTIFLVQEIEKFNKLLNTVSASLYELKKAIIGEVVMSATLDDIYNDLLNNKVPNLWKNVSYPSLKPLSSWILDLGERIIFINNWLINGKPKTYWISAFFFQQGFITGILQNHSRKYKIPIDILSFEFNVLNNKYSPKEIEDNKEKEIDGVYVYGLYLDGAKWNDINGTLKDANIGELYYKMPIIHFIPCKNHIVDENKYYNCPLYKTSVRAGVLSTTGQSTNYILPIELKTTNQKKSKYWIKRGVALLTQLND